MRGKKLDKKTKADIIRLSKDYSPGYISQHLGVHRSTVRKYIQREAEQKAMASPSFQRHTDDLSNALRGLISSNRTQLLQASLAHFSQESPEYTLNGIPQEVLDKMELLANSRSFKFCPECPICQAIKVSLKTGEG